MAIIHRKCDGSFEKYISQLNKTKFDFKIFESPRVGTPYIAIATKGKLKELFDLELLKKDYADNYITIDISGVAEKSLSDYFDDWDAQDDFSKIKTWETGLILGYPVENTISIYKYGTR